MDTRPYVVHQGDYMQSLAIRFGFDASVVWSDPKHDGLRKQGRTPDILYPGDVLYLPEPKRNWLPVKVGQVNHFKVPDRRQRLTLTFQSEPGAALANAACTYDGLLAGPEPPPTSTDAAGTLALSVSTRQQPFTVTFP